ncbi:MAG: YggT family protein [Candidatus Cloacimonadota bacterium]|nr:YggT family protein [Candidatus Cloacimonadota bacterium]
MALLNLIYWALGLYVWLIFIRAIISWFNPNYSQPIIILLMKVTEPVLEPIRRGIRNLFPNSRLRIDISPLIVIFIIEIIRSQIVKMIIQ